MRPVILAPASDVSQSHAGRFLSVTVSNHECQMRTGETRHESTAHPKAESAGGDPMAGGLLPSPRFPASFYLVCGNHETLKPSDRTSGTKRTR